MLKNVFTRISILFAIILPSFSFLAIPVSGNASPSFSAEFVAPETSFGEFTKSVINGNSSQLVGVYVDSILADPVVQQPAGKPSYVSTQDGVVTQFAYASKYGSVGLVAHNNLAGANFSLLQVGDIITLVYGDGSARNYSVTQIKQYQALSPTSPYSSFRDLEDPSTILDVSTVFQTIYAVKERLVLQTCIAKDGVDSWGRLFIIAEPAVDISPSIN
jgi:hypothetical protein